MDIRFPIGWLFTAIGALLVIQGWTHAAPSTFGGINVNAVWGAVQMAFGLVMWMLARRRARRVAGAGDASSVSR